MNCDVLKHVQIYLDQLNINIIFVSPYPTASNTEASGLVGDFFFISGNGKMNSKI